MWLIIALVAIWGTVLVAWLVSWVLAIARARDVGTIRYRQSRSDVRKGTRVSESVSGDWPTEDFRLLNSL